MTGQGWEPWRRDNPVGLLGYISAEGIAPLLPGLPPRAEGRDGDRLARLRAIYGAFVGAGIWYADEPIASTGQVQQIRPPDQVLALPRHGNCLDLAVTFAGACLNAGLHPLLVVCDRADTNSAHAIVVVWLEGSWPGPGGNSRYEAPDTLNGPVLTSPCGWRDSLRQTAEGPGVFIPIDISRVAVGFDGTPASFDDAVTAAASVLNGTVGRADQGGQHGSASAGRPVATGWRWEFGLDVGLGYLPERALTPPGWPTVSPLDPPYQQAASAGDGPLAQLRARVETVPFVDRGELDLLLDWCRSSDEPVGALPTVDQKIPAAQVPPVRIAVIEGVGGSGKTRLAAEAAKRLAEEGWYSGFAVRRVPTGSALRWLADVVSPLLVVVDYAEATELAALSEAIRTLATRRGRTVLFFIARSRGEWWPRLDRELTSAGVVRSIFPELTLPARPAESERLFSRAYRRFTTGGNSAIHDDPPVPASRGRWTALDMVMLAWMAARVGPDLPATPADLYTAVIERELAAWADAIERNTQRRPTQRTLRIAAACISLLSPVQSRLAELLDHAGIHAHTSLAPREIAESLAGLLGQGDANELRLTPDPVADYLLLTTFSAEPVLFQICVDSLPRPAAADAGSRVRVSASDTDLPEPERFCDNLTRASEAIVIDHARSTAAALATAALRRMASLWPAAIKAAINRGGAFIDGLEELAAQADSSAAR